MIILNSIVYAADLADLSAVWNSMVQKWISPIVIMVMGALSLKFLLNRQWSQFINFLSIGIGVAVVVYIAPVMFNENSDLINSASDTAKMINWNEYDWIVWYIIHESNPYPIMKPVRIQITGFIVFEWKYIILKIRENRCRPQGWILRALWTAYFIETMKNRVYDSWYTKCWKSLSESKWAFQIVFE